MAQKGGEKWPYEAQPKRNNCKKKGKNGGENFAVF